MSKDNFEDMINQIDTSIFDEIDKSQSGEGKKGVNNNIARSGDGFSNERGESVDQYGNVLDAQSEFNESDYIRSSSDISKEADKLNSESLGNDLFDESRPDVVEGMDGEVFIVDEEVSTHEAGNDIMYSEELNNKNISELTDEEMAFMTARDLGIDSGDESLYTESLGDDPYGHTHDPEEDMSDMYNADIASLSDDIQVDEYDLENMGISNEEHIDSLDMLDTMGVDAESYLDNGIDNVGTELYGEDLSFGGLDSSHYMTQASAPKSYEKTRGAAYKNKALDHMGEVLETIDKDSQLLSKMEAGSTVMLTTKDVHALRDNIRAYSSLDEKDSSRLSKHNPKDLTVEKIDAIAMKNTEGHLYASSMFVTKDDKEQTIGGYHNTKELRKNTKNNVFVHRIEMAADNPFLKNVMSKNSLSSSDIKKLGTLGVLPAQVDGKNNKAFDYALKYNRETGTLDVMAARKEVQWRGRSAYNIAGQYIGLAARTHGQKAARYASEQGHRAASYAVQKGQIGIKGLVGHVKNAGIQLYDKTLGPAVIYLTPMVLNAQHKAALLGLKIKQKYMDAKNAAKLSASIKILTMRYSQNRLSRVIGGAIHTLSSWERTKLAFQNSVSPLAKFGKSVINFSNNNLLGRFLTSPLKLGAFLGKKLGKGAAVAGKGLFKAGKWGAVQFIGVVGNPARLIAKPLEFGYAKGKQGLKWAGKKLGTGFKNMTRGLRTKTRIGRFLNGGVKGAIGLKNGVKRFKASITSHIKAMGRAAGKILLKYAIIFGIAYVLIGAIASQMDRALSPPLTTAESLAAAEAARLSVDEAKIEIRAKFTSVSNDLNDKYRTNINPDDSIALARLFGRFIGDTEHEKLLHQVIESDGFIESSSFDKQIILSTLESKDMKSWMDSFTKVFIRELETTLFYRKVDYEWSKSEFGTNGLDITNISEGDANASSESWDFYGDEVYNAKLVVRRGPDGKTLGPDSHRYVYNSIVSNNDVSLPSTQELNPGDYVDGFKWKNGVYEYSDGTVFDKGQIAPDKSDNKTYVEVIDEVTNEVTVEVRYVKQVPLSVKLPKPESSRTIRHQKDLLNQSWELNPDLKTPMSDMSPKHSGGYIAPEDEKWDIFGNDGTYYTLIKKKYLTSTIDEVATALIEETQLIELMYKTANHGISNENKKAFGWHPFVGVNNQISYTGFNAKKKILTIEETGKSDRNFVKNFKFTPIKKNADLKQDEISVSFEDIYENLGDAMVAMNDYNKDLIKLSNGTFFPENPGETCTGSETSGTAVCTPNKMPEPHEPPNERQLNLMDKLDALVQRDFEYDYQGNLVSPVEDQVGVLSDVLDEVIKDSRDYLSQDLINYFASLEGGGFPFAPGLGGSKMLIDISATYGTYGYNGAVGKPHNGLDIAVPVNSPILSMFGGTVTGIRTDIHGVDKSDANARGNWISVETQIPDYQGTVHRVTVTYMHMVHGWNTHDTTKSLKVGSVVEAGQLIGYSGNTGYSTGPHLHVAASVNGQWFNPTQLFDFPTIDDPGYSYTGLAAGYTDSEKLKNDLINFMVPASNSEIHSNSKIILDLSGVFGGAALNSQGYVIRYKDQSNAPKGAELDVCSTHPRTESMKTFMHRLAITDKGSPHYKLAFGPDATIDPSTGIIMVNGRYLVAMSKTYGAVNTELDITIGGKVVPVKLSDIKAQTDCQHDDGSMLEFIVATDKEGVGTNPNGINVNALVGQMGSFNYLDQFKGPIQKIVKVSE